MDTVLTLLLVAAVLACPLLMWRMMRHSRQQRPPGRGEAERHT